MTYEVVLDNSRLQVNCFEDPPPLMCILSRPGESSTHVAPADFATGDNNVGTSIVGDTGFGVAFVTDEGNVTDEPTTGSQTFPNHDNTVFQQGFITYTGDPLHLGIEQGDDRELVFDTPIAGSMVTVSSAILPTGSAFLDWGQCIVGASCTVHEWWIVTCIPDI